MVEKTTASTIKITKLKAELEETPQSSSHAIGFVIPEEEKEEEYYEDDE